jgi:hypothetical protein
MSLLLHIQLESLAPQLSDPKSGSSIISMFRFAEEVSGAIDNNAYTSNSHEPQIDMHA